MRYEKNNCFFMLNILVYVLNTVIKRVKCFKNYRMSMLIVLIQVT